MTKQLKLYLVYKAESFSFKIRNKTTMPTLGTFIQHSIENLG